MSPILKRGLKDQGVVVTLSGDLSFVSIDEILRLVSRSDRAGSVHVTGDGFRGRVFVRPDGVDVATLYDDAEMSRRLANYGMRAGDVGIEEADELNTVVALFREMTVESLYQIGLHGQGFEVHEGDTAPFASPTPFELESILDQASKRASEWEAVSRLVPDLSQRIHFETDLGDRDSITVPSDAWKVVTEVGDGSSVTEIADRLGTTTFSAARAVGKLMEEGLLRFDGDAFASVEQTEVATPEPTEHQDLSESGEDIEPEPTAGASSPEPEETTSEHDRSWWIDRDDDSDEPVTEEQGDSLFGRFARRAEQNGAEQNEGETKDPVGETVEGETATITVTPTDTVEDDTEAFLEKVFSELGSETEHDEEEDGYGLLRRRGLGNSQDAPSDS